jgi:hypothetical protein
MIAIAMRGRYGLDEEDLDLLFALDAFAMLNQYILNAISRIRWSTGRPRPATPDSGVKNTGAT